MSGKIRAICLSKKKGVVKKEIGSGIFIEDFGLKGDALAGKWHRQVSLLGIESMNKMKTKGIEIKYGNLLKI